MAKREPKSLFRKLTRLFRSGPVVKRKIRALDTTMAVADKTKSSGTLLFQKSLSPTYATITSNAYNLSERLMRYQDFQEMEYSVSYHTLVATPEGFKQIGELAADCAVDQNKTFIVYSYDHEKKKIVPALAKQARQTCVDHAWKVTFDSGQSITASSEHRLMLRDGTYRKVEDLQFGDSMMPFYRKDLFAGAEEGTKGYSWVYTMDDRFNGWTKEHQLIAEWTSGRKLRQDECVHHINFNKTDNRPENLRIMTNSDHNSYHATINNNVKWAPENHEWIEEFKKNHAMWMRDNAPTRRHDVTFSRILQTAERVGFSIISIARTLDITPSLINERLVANGFASFTKFATAYASHGAYERDRNPGRLTRDLTLDEIKTMLKEDDTKRSLCIKLGCTVNVLDKFLSRRVNVSWSALREQLGFMNTPQEHRAGGRPKGSNGSDLTFQQICDAFESNLTLPRLSEKLNVNKNTIISRLAQNGFKKFSEFSTTYQNHKVVSIEYVGKIPLYDLTVDGYKNFATDTVVSHNTPEIAAALDIYADETVSSDEKGRCLHIYSENEKIRELLEDLFYNSLNIEFGLRSWVRNLPVHKDTVIPLLDGRDITIEQLAHEYDAGKQNWVYSIQDKTHRTVPGKVNWCGLTRKDSELVRVWLDDGTYVDCTPDHEWVLRDGSQKRADKLVIGESLMPFYRSYTSSSKVGGTRGYERIYDPASKKTVYTHRVMPLHHWTHKDKGKVVHHVNFNRCDNTPTNLRVMLAEDHKDLHSHLANRYNSSDLHKQHKRMTGVVPVMRSKHPNNHKVIRVEKLEQTSDVYCMEVLGSNGEHDRHNFMVLSRHVNGDNSVSGVCVSNCKYGDFFLYNDVSPEYGVINAFPIPVNEIEREENYDRDDPFAVRYRWVTMGNRTLENWEVTHFRLLGNDMFLPYGSSIIEPARRIWRQLILIEDAMLVYRVVRAPERRVFYIDVANVPPNEVDTYVEKQRQAIRTAPVVDRTTGRVDLRYNPMSVEEDYLIPIRGNESGTKIDTLQGGQNIAAVEDVAYIQKKLFAALKIPRAYLGYDEMLSSKATLAQEDIRFSRTISVIQKTMIAELNKLAIVHLFTHGFDSDDLQNFTLRLSNPSTVAQQQKLELWRAKFEIAGSAPEGMASKEFVRREIWGLNQEQIEQIDDQRLKEKFIDATIESAGVPGGDEGGAAGGEDDLFGGGDAGGGDEGGAGAEPETPPEENAGVEPEEDVDPGLQLLTADEDRDDEESYALKLKGIHDKPINVQNQLDKVLYNRGRRRTHGPSKTHMPDFVKMTGNSGSSMEDPYDNDWIKSVISNPFAEATMPRKSVGKLPSDITSTLRRMSSTFKLSGMKQGNMLSESRDIQDEIDGDNVHDLLNESSMTSLDDNELVTIIDEDDEDES